MIKFFLSYFHDGSSINANIGPYRWFCAMSYKLFASLASALEHIVKFYDPQCHIIHYPDDFLFINSTPNNYVKIQKTYSCHCAKIGVPLAPDKTTIKLLVFS